MFKQLALAICLLSLSSNTFTMIFEEDEDNYYLAGTLTCSSERYPVVKRKKVCCHPLKKAIKPTPSTQKNDRSCLSLLKSLLQQYEHACSSGFVNIQ